MRINEATADNMAVLRDCLDVIIDSLPGRFERDGVVFRYGYNMPKWKQLYLKYKDTPFGQALHMMYNVLFIFHNGEKHKDSKTFGWYVGHPNNQIQVNISALQSSYKSITKKNLLELRRDDISIKTFRGLLLHELRHFFQSHLYAKYYYGRSDDKPYRQAPVEIDAAWKHHLEDYAVNDYSSVSAYVDAVMDSFANYKKLTDKQLLHFRRKTVRYYLDHTRPSTPDALAVPAQQRLVRSRAAFKESILSALHGLQGDYDLRQLQGYQSDRFFLPSRAIAGTRAIIAQEKPIAANVAPVALLVLSLVVPPLDPKRLLSYLRVVHKITLDDGIEGAEASFAQLNVNTLKSHIAKTFT